MTKRICSLLCAALTVFLLAACTDDPSDDHQTEAAQATAADTTPVGETTAHETAHAGAEDTTVEGSTAATETTTAATTEADGFETNDAGGIDLPDIPIGD